MYSKLYWLVLGICITLVGIVYGDVIRRVDVVEIKADKVSVIETDIAYIKKAVEQISKDVRDLEKNKDKGI